MISRPIAVTAIIGTRPEAIKLAPVIIAAQQRPAQFTVRVIRTGQHRELVDSLMDEFGIAVDVDLHVMQRDQGLAHVMAESVRGLSAALAAQGADWVLVQGDTTSTFAGALAAFYNRIRVGHVEAGLRTGNPHSPFPEEAHRSLTSRIADLHFAPTEQAHANLVREGIAEGAIVVTGNTVVDALLQTLARTRRSAPPDATKPARPYVLVTAHRRENHGAALHRICDAVLALLAAHPGLDARIPMHPSPAVRSVLGTRLAGHPAISLTEPLGYSEFVAALDGAALVLTDSGGIQEECAALGKPVLVLRGDTERPEAVDDGVAVLVGTEPERIVAVASALLSDRASYAAMAHPSDAFGKGTASLRILDALTGWRDRHSSQPIRTVDAQAGAASQPSDSPGGKDVGL
jgi:UDP-N-acetylglucosamine 2-epimerase (non-hydrolysing)